jgi:hypothetical protein
MPKYIPVLGWGAWGFVELISDLYETFIPFYDRTNNIAYVANCIVSVEDEDTKADTVSLRINRCAVKETAGATVQTINGVNVDDLYAWLVVERNGTGDAIPILVENPNF